MQAHYNVFFLILGLCEVPPPDPVYADRFIRGYTTGSMITYTCNMGYYFKEGGTTRTVVCLPNETWSVDHLECIGGYSKKRIAMQSFISL